MWHLSVSVPSGIGKTLREQNVMDHELENWIEKNLIVKINVRFVFFFCDLVLFHCWEEHVSNCACVKNEHLFVSFPVVLSLSVSL